MNNIIINNNHKPTNNIKRKRSDDLQINYATVVKQLQIKQNQRSVAAAGGQQDHPAETVTTNDNHQQQQLSVKSAYPFCNSYMEIKSIADHLSIGNNGNNVSAVTSDNNAVISTPSSVAAAAVVVGDVQTENPYEITRKPAKRKKLSITTTNVDDFCYTNPALNINAQNDKIPINPLEVKRTESTIVTEPTKCGYINSAFNMKCPEKEQCNPFEIIRSSENIDSATVAVSKRSLEGIENPALDLYQPPASPATPPPSNQPIMGIIPPSNFTMGLPFTPTVGCRIDFTDVSLENFTTPSTLLSEKLKFSPDMERSSTPTPTQQFQHQKIDLSIICEEDGDAVDIEKELDCYQLVLENSINEGKVLHKQKLHKNNIKKVTHRRNFSIQLTQAINNHSSASRIDSNPNTITTGNYMNNEQIMMVNENKDTNNICTNNNEANYVDEPQDNHDNKDDDDDDDRQDDDVIEDDEFDKPQEFVRVYRKTIRKTKSDNDLPQINNNVSEEKKQHHGGSVRHSIRQSLRKIKEKYCKSSNSTSEHPPPPAPSSSSTENVNGKIKQDNFLKTIRQSFRRPAQPSSKALKSDQQPSPTTKMDITIIDSGINRKIFKDINFIEPSSNREMMMEEDTEKTDDDHADNIQQKNVFNRATNIRNSIRKSTRDVRKHVMKSVFKQKSEAYDLNN